MNALIRSSGLQIFFGGWLFFIATIVVMASGTVVGSGGGGGCYNFVCSCFIIILISYLYYLNKIVKNIEVLTFDPY